MYMQFWIIIQAVDEPTQEYKWLSNLLCSDDLIIFKHLKMINPPSYMQYQLCCASSATPIVSCH